MGEAIIGIAMLAAMGGLFYLLYSKGYMPVKRMHSLVFVGSMGAGSNVCSASFTKSTGQIERVLRFKESKTVEFAFKGNITKGDVTAFILDRNHKILLMLNTMSPTGQLQVIKGQWYYIQIRFDHADGDYTMKWMNKEEL